MNNDELVTRRAQAIAEDRCFSKGRLRDEFRMKPAPGAEPVKWYKNTYGDRFAVYNTILLVWDIFRFPSGPRYTGNSVHYPLKIIFVLFQWKYLQRHNFF